MKRSSTAKVAVCMLVLCTCARVLSTLFSTSRQTELNAAQRDSGASRPLLLPWCPAGGATHINGSWTARRKRGPVVDSVLDACVRTTRGCECAKQRFGERADATWTPRNCRLAAWSAARFCALLGARRILFLGDSTMQQTHAAVVNALNIGGATCQGQVEFDFADTLSGVQHQSLNRGAAWHKMLRAYPLARKPGIVVLGAMAHVIPQTPFGAGADEEDAPYRDVVEDVASRAAAFDAAGDSTRFLWKTANPPGGTARAHIGGDELSSTPEALPKRRQSFRSTSGTAMTSGRHRAGRTSALFHERARAWRRARFSACEQATTAAGSAFRAETRGRLNAYATQSSKCSMFGRSTCAVMRMSSGSCSRTARSRCAAIACTCATPGAIHLSDSSLLCSCTCSSGGQRAEVEFEELHCNEVCARENVSTDTSPSLGVSTYFSTLYITPAQSMNHSTLVPPPQRR